MYSKKKIYSYGFGKVLINLHLFTFYQGNLISTRLLLTRALEMKFLLKVTVDLRGVFWGKQYGALCINGKYINLYRP